MSNLIIKIFDVGAGLAIYVKTPNGKKIFLDCGGTSELSPAHIINPSDDKISLDYLVISHPHLDHISDIINVSEKYNIDVLRRNKNLDAETMRIDNPDAEDNECLKKYFSISDKFTKTVKGDESPKNESWENGCTFHTFNNLDTNLCVNDQSVVTFIDYGHTTILCGGDVEEKGWDELLKNVSFLEYLKKTSILIAPHHGNDSGYNKKLFGYFTPKITIFSTDSPENTVGEKYRDNTEGLEVRTKNGKECRKILTTNNDGHMKIVVTSKNEDPTITINLDESNL